MITKLCRFEHAESGPRVGILEPDLTILDLTARGLDRLTTLLDHPNPAGEILRLRDLHPPRLPSSSVRLLPPVERQEVWAAGVTYLRSKRARMEESEFSATAYDRVYEAERPELFFKSLAEKVVGPNDAVGIRRDAKWSVPEPELALVFNTRGALAGFTIGNDMSSRDIEGENLLYLPQAKIYERSCALGPCIVVGPDEAAVRQWSISIQILRGNQCVFEGKTIAGQLKRRFDELAAFLTRCQKFPHGAVLLTGTGVVPPDHFTLAAGDQIEITIDGIGLLKNRVVEV